MPIHAQTNELPALVPAYAELPPTFWEQHKTPVVIGILILLALTAFVVWNIWHPKSAPVLPPETIAREALARLQAQPVDGKTLSEVSQIVRRYVGTVYGFSGGEMTTAEFCETVSHLEKIETEFSGAISSFLRECDVRKFSQSNAAAPVNAARHALEIVAQIENEIRRRDACATTR